MHTCIYPQYLLRGLILCKVDSELGSLKLDGFAEFNYQGLPQVDFMIKMIQNGVQLLVSRLYDRRVVTGGKTRT